ncbi:LPXTG cell wall anchor domain-containing protein [Kitasatospora sp. NPDC059408]|uniref:LPXTG cell wall anchor domain-containing protein n=1 Tax=Kitasatospora sp. NPDC059408 TaxID=3346823 RepID=UPI0036874052
MRTSVITRFAKNTRSLSTRRTLAALATTAVLAGGIQILTTDTAWACGDENSAATTATTPADDQAVYQDNDFALHGDGAKAAFLSPVPTTLTLGGPKVEFGIEIANFSKADYNKVSAGLGLFNPHGGTPRPSQVTVEVMDHGHWKRLAMKNGCDPAIHAAVDSLGEPLAVGHARRYMFRVAVSADAPKDLNELEVYGGAFAPATTHVKVVRPAPAAKPVPTASAKPSASAKPKAAPAKPAADETKAAAPAAPAAEAPKSPVTSPTSAPATTAPAGTPELAQTGSSSNGFLAGSAAALLALGAGVLIAVRRLRPQR